MRQLFFVLGVFISSHVFTQSGVYEIDHTNNRSDGTKVKWILTLNDDATFLYNFYRKVKGAAEENFYGKGTWNSKKNLVFFSSEKETDLDEKYIYDFTNTKARWITKSPRDLSGKEVKESLLFYESDLSVIKGLKFYKKSNYYYLNTL